MFATETQEIDSGEEAALAGFFEAPSVLLICNKRSQQLHSQNRSVIFSIWNFIQKDDSRNQWSISTRCWQIRWLRSTFSMGPCSISILIATHKTQSSCLHSPKMEKDGISYQYLSCFAKNELEKIVRIGRQVREGSDSRTYFFDDFKTIVLLKTGLYSLDFFLKQWN